LQSAPIACAASFDHDQPAPGRNLQDRIHVGALAVQMDGQNRPCLRRDLRFDPRRIQIVGPRIDIDEDRRAPSRAIAAGRGKNVYGVVITSSPAPISSDISSAARRRCGRNGHGVAAAAILRQLFLALGDGAPRMHCCESKRRRSPRDFLADRRILRLQVSSGT